MIGWRAMIAAVAATAAFAATAASASAATYFVEEGGTGADPCAQADPCGSIQEAIEARRGNSPAPGDVIEVAEGTYPENVGADDPLDAGLTIRGELDSDGYPVTVVSGAGPGHGACGCVMYLVGEVEAQNLELSQEGTAADANANLVETEGGADLTTVDVPEIRDAAATTAAVVVGCATARTEIAASLIDTRGALTDAIATCTGVTLEDSTVITDDARPISQASGGPGTRITRSFVAIDDPFAVAPAVAANNLTVDSSIIAGGENAVVVQASAAPTTTVQINNATLDAAFPGDEDPDPGVLIEPQGATDVNVDVDSSILLEEIDATDGVGGTITCEYTNFLGLTDDGDFTDECPPANAPGSTNTDLFPQEMFIGPDPSLPLDFDWSLEANSPAVDSGQPGPVPSGFSTTDFFEDPRIQAGRAANCPTGIRDKGAIEREAVNCNATLTVSTVGTGAGTVTGPGINCGAGGTDCAETVVRGTTIELTATAAGGSEFAGFSGGGCSASPCAVVLDGSRTVQARFTNTNPDERTLTVQKRGSGAGTITGPGIDCGDAGHDDCSQSYPRGAEIELTATPGRGAVFRRFSGSGCEATPCTVTMAGARAVVGRFSAAAGPRTSFAKRPKRATRRPVFRLRSTAPASTFECRVDRGEWEECGPRVRLRGLKPGRHALRARATDADGLTGPVATARFRVPRRR